MISDAVHDLEKRVAALEMRLGSSGWGGTLAREYRQNHRMVARIRGSASKRLCEYCGKQARDWAQVHNTTGVNPDEYFPLCRACHMKYDRPTS